MPHKFGIVPTPGLKTDLDVDANALIPDFVIQNDINIEPTRMRGETEPAWINRINRINSLLQSASIVYKLYKESESDECDPLGTGDEVYPIGELHPGLMVGRHFYRHLGLKIPQAYLILYTHENFERKIWMRRRPASSEVDPGKFQTVVATTRTCDLDRNGSSLHQVIQVLEWSMDEESARKVVAGGIQSASSIRHCGFGDETSKLVDRRVYNPVEAECWFAMVPSE